MANSTAISDTRVVIELGMARWHGEGIDIRRSVAEEGRRMPKEARAIRSIKHERHPIAAAGENKPGRNL